MCRWPDPAWWPGHTPPGPAGALHPPESVNQVIEIISEGQHKALCKCYFCLKQVIPDMVERPSFWTSWSAVWCWLQWPQMPQCCSATFSLSACQRKAETTTNRVLIIMAKSGKRTSWHTPGVWKSEINKSFGRFHTTHKSLIRRHVIQ